MGGGGVPFDRLRVYAMLRRDVGGRNFMSCRVAKWKCLRRGGSHATVFDPRSGTAPSQEAAKSKTLLYSRDAKNLRDEEWEEGMPFDKLRAGGDASYGMREGDGPPMLPFWLSSEKLKSGRVAE